MIVLILVLLTHYSDSLLFRPLRNAWSTLAGLWPLWLCWSYLPWCLSRWPWSTLCCRTELNKHPEIRRLVSAELLTLMTSMNPPWLTCPSWTKATGPLIPKLTWHSEEWLTGGHNFTSLNLMQQRFTCSKIRNLAPMMHQVRLVSCKLWRIRTLLLSNLSKWQRTLLVLSVSHIAAYHPFSFRWILHLFVVRYL